MKEQNKSKSQLAAELLALRRQVTQLESLRAEHIRTGEVLLRLNRAHKAISTCNRALLQAKQETELLNDICQIIVEIGGYCFAWVGFIEHDEKKSVLPVAQAGHEEGYLSKINLSWADNGAASSPTGEAIRTSSTCMKKNIQEDTDNAPWRIEAIERGYTSLIAIPLIAGGETFGVLNIYALEKDAFDMEEVKLLIKLADNLSYGIMALRTRVERSQAMKALNIERERLRSLYDNSPDAIIVLDRDFKVTYANQRTEDVSGVSLKEIVGKKCHKAIIGSPAVCDGCMVREVFKEKKLKDRIKHEVTAKGIENWLWQIWYPLLNHEGEVDCIVEIARDVTEKKRAENALLESEKRYRSLFEDSPVSLWEEDFSEVKNYIDNLREKGIKDFIKYFEVNPKAVAHCVTLIKIIDVNKSTLKLYQAKNKKELLKSLDIVFSEESYDTFKEHFIAISEGKTVFEAEAVNRTLKGNQIHVTIKWSVAPGHEKTLSKVTTSVADITKRKLAVEALQKSEKRFRDVAMSTSDWIWEVDPQGRYTYCSKRVEKVLGYTAKELLGKTPFDLMPPKEAARIKKIFKKISERQDPIVNLENWNVSKVGCNICLLTNGIPFYDKQGNFIGYRGVDKDITERKLAEEALRDNAQELKKHRDHLEDLVADRTAELITVNQQLQREITERKQAEEELAKHRQQLEGLVKERTAELTKANKQLKQEIKERKQAEESLKKIEVRLRTAIDSLPFYFFAIDKSGRYFLQNTKLKQDWGDLIGKRPEDVKVDKDTLALWQNNNRRASAGETVAEEVSYKLKGKQKHFYNIISPIREADQILGIMGINIDITKHKQAEEELKHSLEKLRRNMDEIIQALEYTVEIRDVSTAGHQRRVAELACAIAREMCLPEEQLDGLRIAAVIHDIGKINVPTAILNKPRKLSEVEFALVKTHVQIGYGIFKEIEFPQPVAQIVFQHHERMDGSGYPLGLSGEDILIEARILGVADVVEAMCSPRPYRPALGIDKALDEISRNKGVFYDAKVVDSTLKLFLNPNNSISGKTTANCKS